MKKVVILCLAIAILSFFGYAQTIENLDYISPFHNGLAAVKKGNNWAFINNSGDLMMDFRSDLALTKSKEGNYPLFFDGRCLITDKKDGITYFGYIDATGKTVVEPRFLNAANFNNGKALALEIIKENLTRNAALDKNMVYYKYVEVIIDTRGKVENYLNPKGVNFVLDKDFLRIPPEITAKRLSNNLVAMKNRQGKWSVIKVK